MRISTLVIAAAFAAAPIAIMAQGAATGDDAARAADSLYRAARLTLNRGEYRRAADLFHSIAAQYPRSDYLADSGYWEAFARYRIGSTDELRAAAAELDALAAGSTGTRFAREADVAALRARIDGALGLRGEAVAARRVAREAARAGSPDASCDQEDLMVRVEALNALAQMDQTSALPILRRVLERRDECSVELRRRALYILARRQDTTAASILAAVAHNDSSATVRAEAVGFLARMPGDGVLRSLEDLLRTSTDERVQRAVVRSLLSSDGARARQSLRTLIERKDAPEALRFEAIASFDRERATDDDAAWLRGVYPRLDSERLKEAVIAVLARQGGKDNQEFLVGVVKNPGESSRLRATALSRAGRSVIPVADLGKMYDAADSRTMREQIISLLGNRTEPEATDKLFDIAKAGTDPNMRRYAINVLSRRNDPRVTKLLMELIDK